MADLQSQPPPLSRLQVPPAAADVADMDAGKVASVEWPDKRSRMHFLVTVTPDSGLWKSASFQFDVTVPKAYPHEPPKVRCTTPIYHPNIDWEGAVCLNILRKDWKPVLDLNAVVYGLIMLFYEPNANDPLNHGELGRMAALLRRARLRSRAEPAALPGTLPHVVPLCPSQMWLTKCEQTGQRLSAMWKHPCEAARSRATRSPAYSKLRCRFECVTSTSMPVQPSQQPGPQDALSPPPRWGNHMNPLRPELEWQLRASCATAARTMGDQCLADLAAGGTTRLQQGEVNALKSSSVTVGRSRPRQQRCGG